MQVAHRESAPRFGRSAHRPGGIGFISLLRGEEGRVDNFELIIATITEDFHTPRHRHNFDQLRVMLEGSFGFDRDRVQNAGTIGYFCEGTYYQQQGVGHSEALVLQSGGASGNGFMSFEKLYQVVDQLKSRLQTAAIVLGAVADGKVQLVAGVTADATARIKAGELVNFVAQQVGGKGGGRPDLAMAGGTDGAALPGALAAVEGWARARL